MVSELKAVDADQSIKIEVAFALPDRQTLLEVSIVKGTTVKDAVVQSGIMQRYPEIDLEVNAVGIWNRTCKLTDVPREGDRIEVYRPLIADPKDVRRRRAEKAKEEGRADKVTGGRVKQRG